MTTSNPQPKYHIGDHVLITFPASVCGTHGQGDPVLLPGTLVTITQMSDPQYNRGTMRYQVIWLDSYYWVFETGIRAPEFCQKEVCQS